VFALSAAKTATRLPVAEATLLPPSICFRPPVRRSAGPPVRLSAGPPACPSTVCLPASPPPTLRAG